MDYGSALVKLDHYSIYFKLSNVKQNSLEVQLLEKLMKPLHLEIGNQAFMDTNSACPIHNTRNWDGSIYFYVKHINS